MTRKTLKTNEIMNKIDTEELNIMYEDNHILVVVKPQNVPSCPDDSGDDDLLSALKRYLVEKYNKPGDAFLGLVHRLDRPTGGVMVFAKTSKAAARLSESIRAGQLEKKYLAVTCAVLEYKTLDVKKEIALVEIKLITGRSHQARVQLATAGTPIFGDAKYAKGKSPSGYNLALWAVELRFPHPTNKETMVFRVYPPVEDVPWKFFDVAGKLSIIK